MMGPGWVFFPSMFFFPLLATLLEVGEGRRAALCMGNEQALIYGF